MAGLAGGFIGGAAVVSGIPILSGFSVSSSLGGGASSITGAALNDVRGNGLGKAFGIGLGVGFTAGWVTGIANREFNTDGVIQTERGSGGRYRATNVKNAVVAYTSQEGDVFDWFWSTLVGGYSHVNHIDENGYFQEEFFDHAQNYGGRGYKIISRGHSQTFSLSKMNESVGNRIYSSVNCNCSTSLSAGLGIPSQWTPYNIYSYYNYPQFGYWWSGYR